MLVNEELKGLSSNDLTQRYAESYVNYNGKVAYINGFKMSSMGLLIEFLRDEDGAWLEPFRWDYLDTYRPPPKMVCVDGNFLWCWYNHQRQWCRGFSFGKNCEATLLYQDSGKDFKNILREWLLPEVKDKISEKDMVYTNNKVLSRSLAYVRGRIYYRGVTIGNTDSGVVTLSSPKFLPEMQEHVEMGVKIDVK
jgi:hypothetical protein